MIVLYTILLYLAQPVILLRLLFRSCKISAYRKRLLERYGFCKNKVASGGILLHSVSVGEVLTSISLIRALLFRYPSIPIVVTTTTPTGSKLITSYFKKEINHVYFPYDLPCAINRFFNTVQPKLVIMKETEIWPNVISFLYRQKIPLVIVDARLSEYSAKRYSKLGKKFVHSLLRRITLIAAQNKEDAERFIALGLQRKQLAITGSLKFNISITPKLTAKSIALRHQWALNRHVWMAASTHNREEIVILQAHRKLLETFPNLLLILAPRHPERFKKIRNMVQKEGFKFILRSENKTPSSYTQVVIVDTIGELMLLYGITDIAFVGGSLVKKGGHNPLEPAAHAIPILMGPYTFNFKDICAKLREANCLITVIDVNSVIEEVSKLLINNEYRFYCGRQSTKVLNENQGSLSHLLELLQPYLSFR